MSDAAERPPDALSLAATGLVGRVTSARPLGGMSGASVLLLAGPRGSVVAKQVHPREMAFYEGVTLSGVRVPRVLGRADQWLLLEHLPDALPRHRWGADTEVAATLRALHATPTEAIAGVPAPFRPRWDDEMHTAAMTVLSLSASAAATLAVVRRAALPLLEPVAVISGDTNPLNWRLDADGHPVLLDWERLGLGHPAIDLGIALPGLPTREEAAAMVSAYGHPGVTSGDVLVAKAWSVVEFAAEVAARPDLEAMLFAPGVLEDWLADLPVDRE